jgi:aryl-alcohol dehydrogenase-like predicted oxidoreductase
MKYRYLGDSGLLVSRICLGTMTFGTEGWGCDEAASIAITNRFIEGGGNFIDTADLYAACLKNFSARPSPVTTATIW